MPRFVPALGFMLPLVLACGAGCRGNGSVAMPNYGSEEGLKIAQSVSNFNDAKGDAKKFKKMFAGSAPSNWKEYDKYVYEVVVRSPKIDGTSATANVTVHKESNYEVIATKEWAFAKVGDEWRIASAPLP